MKTIYLKYSLLVIVLFSFLCMGCYEEDDLTSTTDPELKYALPQGDHDYDTRIVDWHDRTGCYILYRFEPKDIYWNISEWQEIVWDSRGYWKGLKITTVDENYVGRQLTLLENKFLNFYPDTLLKRCLPQKILLCDTICTYEVYHSEPAFYDIISGFNFLAISHGSKEIVNLNVSQKNQFLYNLNYTFLQRLVDRKQTTIPEEFYSFGNYPTSRPYNYKEVYKRGFLSSDCCLNNATEKKDDWNIYIQAILQYSEAELEAEQPDGDESLKGILSPKKDVEGRIRNKYNTVLKHFKDNHNFDIGIVARHKEITQ